MGEVEMNSLKRLSQIFESAVRIPFDDSSRIILMSDCHRGDGSQADDFMNNENVYLSALNHYYDEGFTHIEIGDGDELWENKQLSDIITAHLDAFLLLRKFHLDNRLYLIYGNHDMVKRSEKYVKSDLYSYLDKRDKRTLPLFENIRVHEGLVLEYKGEERQIRNKRILLIQDIR